MNYHYPSLDPESPDESSEHIAEAELKKIIDSIVAEN